MSWMDASLVSHPTVVNHEANSNLWPPTKQYFPSQNTVFIHHQTCKERDIVRPHRIHCHCYRQSSVVSLSVCRSSSWALQKWLNWSRCRLEADSGEPKEPCFSLLDGVQMSKVKGQFSKALGLGVLPRCMQYQLNRLRCHLRGRWGWLAWTQRRWWSRSIHGLQLFLGVVWPIQMQWHSLLWCLLQKGSFNPQQQHNMWHRLSSESFDHLLHLSDIQHQHPHTFSS